METKLTPQSEAALNEWAAELTGIPLGKFPDFTRSLDAARLVEDATYHQPEPIATASRYREALIRIMGTDTATPVGHHGLSEYWKAEWFDAALFASPLQRILACYEAVTGHEWSFETAASGEGMES